jgi:hypothetical protein
MNNHSQDTRESGAQHEDDKGQARGAKKKSAKVGQPGEEQRTSQQNAGSTEGGGTRNARN